MYKLFYENKKKVIRKELGRYLIPLAIAIWIMDDGGKVSAGLKLATNCWEEEEMEELIKILKEKYGLETSKNKDRKRWVIYVPKRSMEKLAGTVRGHICDSMKYKLNGYL